MRLIFRRIPECECSKWADGMGLWEPPSAGSKIQFNFLSAPVSVPGHGVSLEFRQKGEHHESWTLSGLLIGHKDPGER